MTLSNPAQYISGRTVQEQMNSLIDYVDARAAEVATDAIASDVAQVHQDMLDADADASAAAASAAAAAGTLANAVKKTGEASQSIAGDIAISGALSVSGAVTVPAPTGNTNPATKKYVDDADALTVHLAGNETITGVKQVPLEATGAFSGQAASSNKVKNELDNYAPMVRTANAQSVAGEKTFTSPMIAQIKPLVIFGSNSTNGWYAICKLPKVDRQLVIEVMSPGYYNIAAINVGANTHTVAAFKVAGYTPNANKFLLAEVSDGYILYVYSTTYRTNILKVKDFSVFGSWQNYANLDTSVFTGTPEATKPAVGGDITAVYDETLMQVVTT